MKKLDIRGKKKLNKLIHQYTKLVHSNTYKGQYALVRQIKPLIKRLQAQANEALYVLERNERTRKRGVPRKDYSHSCNTIGKYSVKKVRKIHNSGNKGKK